MEHRELEELLTPFLLGDTTPDQSEQVRGHLEECESCRALAQELEMTLDFLRDALAADAPEAVPRRLSPEHRDAVFGSRSPVRLEWLGKHRLGIGFAAAAAAVMILLGAMVMPLTRPASMPALAKSETTALGRELRESERFKRRMSAADELQQLAEPAAAPAPARSGSREFYSVDMGQPLDEMSRGSDLSLQSEESVSLRTAKGDVVSTAISGPESKPESRLNEFAFEGRPSVEMESLQEIVSEEPAARRQVEAGFGSGEEDAGSAKEESESWFGLARGSGSAVNDEEVDDGVSAGAFASSGDVAGGDLYFREVGQGVDTGRGRNRFVEQDVERVESVERMARLPASIRAGVEEVDGDNLWAMHGVVSGKDAAVSDLDAVVAAGERTADVGESEERQWDVPALSTVAGAAGAGSVSYRFDGGESGIQRDDRTGEESPESLEEGALITTRSAGRAPASPAPVTAVTEESKMMLGDRPVLGSLFVTNEKGLPVATEEQPPIFLGYGVSAYRAVADQPISTFGIDVDTASYTLARRYLESGSRPPADAVRTEEFVNFFDYDYRPPSTRIFAIHAVGAPSPFGDGLLVKIGIKGKRLGRDDQKPAMLTFVVDTSGSMDTDDRLGLVKISLHLLLGELDPSDRVAIIQVDSEARLVLEHTPVGQVDVIRAVIDGLQCSGSTHLAAGIELGYEVAARGFVGGAVNRVLILSDGAANLGSANPEEILARVASSRDQGIVSSVFGFGLGTYNDAMLETLANRGDGAYHFIDSTNQARQVFVDDLSVALNVIARDVKIQMEFDPARVAQYRQLGYENRQLKTEDFRNDAVDAGEVGSGQSVTALYELILTEENRGRVGVIRVRYRDEQTGAIEEISRELRDEDLRANAADAGTQFRLAACVAEYAELLRKSPFAADGSFSAVATELRPIAMELHLDQRVSELLRLVQHTDSLPVPTP